jgi:hypothetical protein
MPTAQEKIDALYVKSNERLNYWRCTFCEKEIFGSARLARLGHLAGEKGRNMPTPCNSADIPESVVKIAKDEFDKQSAAKKEKNRLPRKRGGRQSGLTQRGS